MCAVYSMADENQSNPPASASSKSNSKRCFRPNWKDNFPWVEFKNDRMFCSSCRQAVASKFRVNQKNAFVHEGSICFKVSALQRHEWGSTNAAKKHSTEHSRLVNLLKLYKPKDPKAKPSAAAGPLERVVARGLRNELNSPGIATLFHTVYHLCLRERPLS